MIRKYKIHDQDNLYFVSFAFVYWVDMFIENDHRNILLDSWNLCITYKRMVLYGYCIMTSHVHMILGTQVNNMEDLMRDMKQHTSLHLKAAIHNNSTERRGMLFFFILSKPPGHT